MYLHAFGTGLCRNSGAFILMKKVWALLSLYVYSLLTQRQEDMVWITNLGSDASSQQSLYNEHCSMS